MKWLYLIVAILAEVIATSALKYSEGFTRLVPSAIVIAGYAVAFYFLSLTLQHMSVGIAYAIWSGLGTLLIAITSAVLLKQKLDTPAIMGLALIVAGVVVINVFSEEWGVIDLSVYVEPTRSIQIVVSFQKFTVNEFHLKESVFFFIFATAAENRIFRARQHAKRCQRIFKHIRLPTRKAQKKNQKTLNFANAERQHLEAENEK
jgi:small multidrug resistance pump